MIKRSQIDVMAESVGSLTVQLAGAIALNDLLREQNEFLGSELVKRDEEIEKLNGIINNYSSNLPFDSSIGSDNSSKQKTN